LESLRVCWIEGGYFGEGGTYPASSCWGDTWERRTYLCPTKSSAVKSMMSGRSWVSFWLSLVFNWLFKVYLCGVFFTSLSLMFAAML
jgi:hypothetical protein